MTTVKPQGEDLKKLQSAAALLKASNSTISAAEKVRDAAKQEISQWLKKERQIDTGALEVGDVVNVEGVCLVERVSMNKFDEKGFLLAHAALHAEFKKDFAFTKIKPLVP
jgi:hypothetical protein